MTTFKWHITETLPYDLTGRTAEASAIFSVTTEDFDIAIDDLPFILDIGRDQPHERLTAPWRKEQFDADRDVGEQSLTGWWLRSQSNFSGGSGITYFEPFLGQGSERRFRDSRGVNVWHNSGEVTLLHELDKKVDLAGVSVEAVAGSARVLIRDSGTLSVWDGSSEDSVSGTSTANSLANAGTLFLVGDDDGIQSLDTDTGTSLTPVWTDASGPVRVWWAKQRIFAAIGPDLYELTLAGGDLSVTDPLYTHPDPGWTWTSVTETGGAVWAAGFGGERSAIHVIGIDADGSIPELTAATVGIQLPTGEIANVILGYLDFLIVGTSEGLRVAVTQGTQAALGPLVFREQAVHSLTARGDFAWAGVADGLTRRVDLGNEIAGDLAFAWANDVEAAGIIQSVGHFQGKLFVAGTENGFYLEADTLVPSGFLTTGFTRFGTMEPKRFQTVLVTARVPIGSLAVASGRNDPLEPIATLSRFDGVRDLAVQSDRAVRMSLQFQLNRSATDPTQGPIFQSYQLRAIPAPTKRQRLIRLPLMCFDTERDRWGATVGGPGFAWERLRALERLEERGAVILLRDFRTGESRMVEIDQIHFSNIVSPDRSERNYGGTIALTVRAVD